MGTSTHSSWPYHVHDVLARHRAVVPSSRTITSGFPGDRARRRCRPGRCGRNLGVLEACSELFSSWGRRSMSSTVLRRPRPHGGRNGVFSAGERAGIWPAPPPHRSEMVLQQARISSWTEPDGPQLVEEGFQSRGDGRGGNGYGVTWAGTKRWRLPCRSSLRRPALRTRRFPPAGASPYAPGRPRAAVSEPTRKVPAGTATVSEPVRVISSVPPLFRARPAAQPAPHFGQMMSPRHRARTSRPPCT